MRRVTQAERVELIVLEMELLKAQTRILQARVRELEIADEARLHALEIAVARYSHGPQDATATWRVVDRLGRVVAVRPAA